MMISRSEELLVFGINGSLYVITAVYVANSFVSACKYNRHAYSQFVQNDFSAFLIVFFLHFFVFWRLRITKKTRQIFKNMAYKYHCTKIASFAN